MSIAECRWLRAQFYRVSPKDRPAWLRENAGRILCCGECL